MKTNLADDSQQFFDLPDNLIRVPIDPQTGQLQVDQSKEPVYALFKIGTEPK